MALEFSLRDRFVERERAVLITGVQSLVRLMLLQAEADRAAGLNTGGFVSGYRGSPLGTLDTAFAAVADLTEAAGIVVRPAINEELGATAVAGTQQIEATPNPKVDGVFSLWYGKGPGLDRASDAVRHGNVQGTSPLGGVVVAIGDDHVSKSSSITCYSDPVAAALLLPLFYPADAEEVIQFGLHGFALSRLSGSWVALKIVPEVADATFSVSPGAAPMPIERPSVVAPPYGLHNRWPEAPLEQEVRQIDFRLAAVRDYLSVNVLDHVLHRTPASRLGIVAAGKSWNDVREALRLLGLAPADLERLGIALFKPAVIWPLQPSVASFATGLEQVIVVEEKGAFIEDQLKAALYGAPTSPRIFGKTGPSGRPLFKATGDLNPDIVAECLRQILVERGDLPPEGQRDTADDEALPALIGIGARRPFFCSGCPHNRSTVVPEGSRALAGIGCHGLAAYNRPRTGSFAQMGGEGVHWVGLSSFTNEQHVFANMGDGTYFHSGLLAVRQAVSAKVNITYKLLYNSAVAMTGGQAVDGDLSIAQLVRQLRAEGVKTIAIASDDPSKYKFDPLIGTIADRIVHREDLEALQLELREARGVSVLIYDQMCATERRRMRKRGRISEASGRAFINELVCEGCGDCSVKSSCLSVEPTQTPFGVKRRINQSSCNSDLSCLDGFCPSFVRIDGAKPKRASTARLAAKVLPDPNTAARGHERIVVAGIGGTGVVTIGALLATAAHVQGHRAGVLDQVGMAQKGGAVASHIHIVREHYEQVTALRMPAGQADLVIACDEVVANSPDILGSIETGRTYVLANEDVAITSDFLGDRGAVPDSRFLSSRLRRRAGADHFDALPFSKLAERLLGDAIGANLMMVGYAFQRGWLCLDEKALQIAIEANGQAVSMNMAAFSLGRRLACDRDEVCRAAGLIESESEGLEETKARLAAVLVSYQDADYAERFVRRVEMADAADRRAGGEGKFTIAAARSLFKLMAYKDEYEVARLFTNGAFAAALAEQFEAGGRATFYMAPPVFARRDPVTGVPRKRAFGGWMLRVLHVLARMKCLRGTRFDVFGWSEERKIERELRDDFETLLERLTEKLSPANLDWATEVVSLPLEIRGFGYVKLAAVEAYRQRLNDLLAAEPHAVGETLLLGAVDAAR